MKRLTERTEIAKAINFNKYPVIKIDLADFDDYGLKGTKVRIDNGTFKSGEPYYINATIRAYNDDPYLSFHQYASGLSARVTYGDYMEMVEYANAPIVKPNQEILIFLYNSATKDVYAPAILQTGSHISPFCSTPLGIEKFDVM